MGAADHRALTPAERVNELERALAERDRELAALRAGHLEDLQRLQSSVSGSTDTTKRAEAQAGLERELRRIERLETFGQVAGGFGHDFNNLLTAILGYVGLAGQQVG